MTPLRLSSDDDAPRGTQPALAFAPRRRMTRETLAISPSNAVAAALIDSWRDVAWHLALLIGDAASGKSHLAEIWRADSRARRALASEVSLDSAARLAESPALLIDDAPGEADPRGMFHLLNRSAERGGSILMCSRRHPDAWASLPDLRSRLRGASLATIRPPDDELLIAVLQKLFADRQMRVDDVSARYLASRMERSAAEAHRIVDVLDRLTSERGGAVTPRLAAEALSASRAG